MNPVHHRRTGLRAPRENGIDVDRVEIAGDFGKPRLVGRGEDARTYLNAQDALVSRRSRATPSPPRPEDWPLRASHGGVMPLDAIYEKLSEILRDQFDDDDIVAGPGLTAGDVDGWDSFAHIRLMLAVEKSFGVAFSASQISSLNNVGDLANLIAAKTGA